MNKVGIIGAMELEVAALKSKMEVKEVVERAGMKFHEGILNGKDVVIVQCGIGKVNAGICVQILADLFGVDAVINTGVAGSLRAEINIGDIVVSTDACEHDMDVSALGYEPGIIPQMETSFFKADRKLAEEAIAVCREVNPEIGVYEGRVVSGDQFISDGAVKDRLISQFDGSCARSRIRRTEAPTWITPSSSARRQRTAQSLWRIWSTEYKMKIPHFNQGSPSSESGQG